MDSDSKKAEEALTNTPENYVNKTACDSIAASCFQDFQMLLQIGIFQLILSRVEDPEKFLNNIKQQWQERASGYLKSEAKRFQDLLFRASASEGKKLSDSLGDTLNNYSNTLSSAYSKANKAVDEIIESLKNHTQTNKEIQK